MDWQADNGLRWSMPGGYFLGPSCQERHCSARAYLGPNNQPTASLLELVGSGALVPAITPQDIAQAAREKRRWHVTGVVVRPSSYQVQLASAMTSLLGHAAIRVDDGWVWILPNSL